MKLRGLVGALAIVLSFVVFCCGAHGAVGEEQTAGGSYASTSDIQSGRVLVTFNALPPDGGYEVIGPISVYKRWFGGLATARRLLADRARELGANAVVESRLWLAPAFPAQVAPHGSGIAVRVTHPEVLQNLVDEASSWE